MTAEGSPERVAGEYLARLTIEGAKALADKIRAHRAVLVTDQVGFEAAKAVRRSAEFVAYKKYISDRDLRLVIVGGLLLRKFEGSPDNKERVQEVLDRLHDRFRSTGVRQAEFVQRGMLLRVIKSLEESGAPKEVVAAQAQALLRRVEKHTRFVRDGDNPELVANEIVIRVLEGQPDTFIVFAKGRARDVAKEAVRLAMKGLPNTFIHRREETDYDYIDMIGESEDGKLRIEWWAPR